MATIRVSPGSSIQQAINAAVDGDIVIVSQGIYKEALTITGKRITLASEFYNTADPGDIIGTVLDGGTNGRDALDLITVTGAVGTKIIGFTIQNGNDGIQINNSTGVEIINNRITNTVDAIDFKGKTSGVIRKNTLENNTDDGVDLNKDASVIVEDNTIRNNDGDGLEIRLQPYTGNTLDIIIRNNLISGNNNDGIQLIDSAGLSNRYIRIEGNRIEKNNQAGLGLMDNEETTEDYRAASIPESIDVLNNTFYGNNYGLTGGDNLVALNNIFAGHTKIAMKGVNGGSTAAYNLFWQNGTDILDSNVNANTTLFANPLLDANLQLQTDSPAIDAGIAAFQWRGKDVLNLPSSAYKGNAPDLGAWESSFTTQPLGSIGDRIWHDIDGDGVQDSGESGIAGVTVKLLNSSKNIITTQVTGSNGNYLFNNLPTDTYYVEVDKNTLPSGATQAGDPDGGNDNTAKVILAETENNLNQDFGYQLPPLGSIGDRIWNDANSDGIEDAGESGIAGVSVKLLDSDNKILATKVTGSNGNYLFNNLQAGTYTVQVDSSKLPSGTTQTGDPDTIKDNTSTFTLAAGENKLDWDFGYKLPTSTKVIEVKVSSSSDDAEQRISGKMNLDSSDLELINDGGNDQLVGLRFVGVNIPQKAIITNAYIQFKVDEANSVATNLTIHGEDVDNAATFTTISRNISSRVRTDASVLWKDVPIWNTVNLAGVEQRTPNLKDVIQEIVNRSGWSSGNSLATIISGTGSRVAQSFDRTPLGVGSPVLHVEFTA
ncbi:right-handed parallel beta-helix repeat-containing protein [Tolypothrix sp. FACHB-123]|uniref:SdrD B-like domain-containing protein n=1 Tax=Tolypothrix sp. FACHB-123 TaxID=2692868 RepID=UPI0016867632|nr:SdrD B-like domain-containing protein [Tolypothrix sp. FACHB-123]MBD2355860.1 right-handed parallel beta-helix repeat-containing protein [Tolypothrix sp. FACHB-123]